MITVRILAFRAGGFFIWFSVLTNVHIEHHHLRRHRTLLIAEAVRVYTRGMRSECIFSTALLFAFIDLFTIRTNYLYIYVQESTLCYLKGETCTIIVYQIINNNVRNV